MRCLATVAERRQMQNGRAGAAGAALQMYTLSTIALDEMSSNGISTLWQFLLFNFARRSLGPVSVSPSFPFIAAKFEYQTLETSPLCVDVFILFFFMYL